MGVKKNGTKKRKIRGGEIIRSTPSFFNGQKGNSVDSKNYAKKAMNTASDIAYNLKFLVDDAISESQKPNNKTNIDTTKKRVNQFVAQMRTKEKIDMYKTEVIQILNKIKVDFQDIYKFLDNEYDKEWLSMYLSEQSSSSTSSSTNNNSNNMLTTGNIQSLASGGPSLGPESVDLDVKSVVSNADSDNNSMFDPRLDDDDTTNSLPISRTGLAPAITNVDGLPWGQQNPSSEIEPVKNYNTFKSDFQLFGKDNKRYDAGFVQNIVADKKSANAYLKGIKDDIIRIKTENDALKSQFDFKFAYKKQQMSEREKKAEDKIKKLLAELTSAETAYKTHETFLNTQRAVLQRYIDKFKTPDITLAVAMYNSEQASDLIQAVIYCINLSSSIPLDTDYYYVDANTKLEDIKAGRFKKEKVMDQAFIDILKQEYNPTNRTKFEKLPTYISMFKNKDLSDKATQIKTYKELLTKLQNVLQPLLPINSKIAVTNGGSIVGNLIRRGRSVTQELDTALKELYKSYSDINTEPLDTRDLEDINNQLQKAIEFFENTKLKKDGLAVTKDITINGVDLIPGSPLDADYIKTFEYQSRSASSSNSASGGPALSPISSGGSRKRKSPKKSARKTNKKQ